MDFDIVNHSTQGMGFFQTFVDLLNYNDDHLDPEIQLYLKDGKFRKHLQTVPLSVELIKQTADYSRFPLMKPQRPIILHDEWYHACDINTNMYYLCSKSVPMIDIDNYKMGEFNLASFLYRCLCELDGPCACKSKSQRLRYRVYKSRNGYHCFVISHKIDYRSDTGIKLGFKSDYFYAVFSYMRGWSVRLNPKHTETGLCYRYLYDIVDGRKIGRNSDLHLTHVIQDNVDIVDEHIRLSGLYTNQYCLSHNVQ